MAKLAKILSYDIRINFLTGRHSGQRELTWNWLIENEIALRQWSLGTQRLFMRDEGDHRPDHIIKLELLEQVIADGYEPIMVFDDRNSVVKMWRDAGIPCAQVAEGNF